MRDGHFACAKHEPQPRVSSSTRTAKLQPSVSIQALGKGRSFLLGFNKLKQKSTDTHDSFNDDKPHEIDPETSKTTSLQPGSQPFPKPKKSRTLQESSRWSLPRARTARPRKESFIDRLFSGNSSSKFSIESTYIQTLRKLHDRERRDLAQVLSLNLILAKLQQRKRPTSAIQELGFYDGRGMGIIYREGVQMAPKMIATNPYAIAPPAPKPASYFSMVTMPDAIMAPPIHQRRWRRPYAETALVVAVDNITSSLVVSSVVPKSFSPSPSRHSTSMQNSRPSSAYSASTQSSRPSLPISEQILPSDLIPTTLDTKKDHKANVPTMLKGGWKERSSIGADMNMNINFTDLSPMGRCLPKDVVMSEHGRSVVAV